MADPLRVLLLEDNPGDARLLREYFAEAAGTPVTLTHVELLSDALHRLREEPFDIILSDLSVPDSHGFETFTQLHAQAPDLPIVVLTGLDDESVAVKAVQEGAQDYLVKGGVSSTLLVRSLRYAIERHRAERKLASYAEELRRRNAELQSDLELARQLQLAMLPQQFPRVPPTAAPQNSALQFFSFYFPTGGVSGDFFDVLPLSDTAVGVFICDVMGHGVRAALVTAMMRALVEDLSPVALGDPGQLLSQLNRGLHGILKQTDLTLFATAFYLVADVKQAHVLYANAGHPTPLLLHRQDCNTELLKGDDKSGPALGLFGDATYVTGRHPLSPGDLLLLFTDGLFEVDCPTGEQYSAERLLTAVQNRAALPSKQIFDELLPEIQQFATRHNFTDDVCLIGMEVQHLA